MIPFDQFTGRFGNRLFQYATLYTEMRDKGIEKEAVNPFFPYYLQNPIYFNKYKDEIKELFGSNVGRIPEIAIHIRRGDYVNNSFYVDLSQTYYYDKAIKEFPNKRFLVFSDDIGYAKTLLKGSQFVFSEGNDEITDFNLMASCSGHIIANSSYSWWAAYISPNYGKVIAPKAWYSDGVERTKCPKEWIRI